MRDLVTHGQVVLLARLLKLEPERLAHLERLSADDVADIRLRLSSVFYDELAHTFGRVAVISPAIPLRLVARFAQKRVPPRLAGRAISSLGFDHPKRSGDLLKFVDPQYAAQVAPFIDPRAVAKVTAIAPAEVVVRIAREILRRRDYITAASIMMAAPDVVTGAVIEGDLDDAEAVKAGAYALSPEVPNRVLRHLLTHRKDRVDALLDLIDRSDDDSELLIATVSMLARCEPDNCAKAAKALLDRGPDLIGKLLRFWIGAGYAADVIRIGGVIDAQDQERFAQSVVLNDPDVISRVVETVTRNLDATLWKGLLEVVEHMPRLGQMTALQVLSAADPTALQVHGHVLTEQGLWPPLLRTVEKQQPEIQALVGRSWLPFLTPRDMRMLRDQVAGTALEPGFEALLATLDT